MDFVSRRGAAIGRQFTITFALHTSERFGAVNLLSVVNFVSSSLYLCVLVCNGINHRSSIDLIVARRDTPALRIVADQAARSTYLRSNLQAMVARGCVMPNKGQTVGRLRGE